MDSQHARRMGAFQDELVQLQNTISSPKAAQSPSSLGGSPVSSVGLSLRTFDLVIGGWEEGCTKDWVKKGLAKLIASAGAQEHVSQTHVHGKHSSFGKFALKLDWGPADRPAFQLKVLNKVRSAQWAPGGSAVWITTGKTHKTPTQRRLSKAVAQLNAFFREQLKVDHGVLEVASWAAAKTFVGESRVTGLSEEREYGTKPRCTVDDLRWLVRDPRLCVNVWLDLVSLSLSISVSLSLSLAWTWHE